MNHNRLPAIEPQVLIANLQQEILRADRTQALHQMAAWREMVGNDKILEGMETDRFLGLSEVRLSFYVDRYPSAVWRRLWARILHFLGIRQTKLWLVGASALPTVRQISLTGERNREGDWSFHTEPELDELRRDYGLTALE